MKGGTRQTVLAAVAFAMALGGLGVAQEHLLPMTFTEDSAEFTQTDRADRGLLIVESTIPNLRFIGVNRPIPAEPGIRVQSPGVWQVWLNVGSTILSIQADGYLPIETRFHFKPNGVRKIRVSGEHPKGTGSLRIETDPPGAKVAFNTIPVPGETPVLLTDQPTGVHSLHIEKNGWRPVDETVVVEKDRTITRRFVLQKIYAGLKITSDPSEAQVYLDGDLLGITPMERTDLSPGEYILVVSKDGYEPNSQPIRLVANYPKTAHADLLPMSGAVSVTTEPVGAEVWVDDQLLGSFKGDPLIKDKLAIGKHTLRARLQDYDDAVAEEKVEYRKTTAVHLRLNPKAGGIFIITTPPGAAIDLDAKPTYLKTPHKLEQVPSGQHELILSLAGYPPARINVQVSPGQVATIVKNLERRGDSYDSSGLAANLEPEVPTAAAGEVGPSEPSESPAFLGPLEGTVLVYALGHRRVHDLWLEADRDFWSIRVGAESKKFTVEGSYYFSDNRKYSVEDYKLYPRFENVSVIGDYLPIIAGNTSGRLRNFLKFGVLSGFDLNFFKIKLVDYDYSETSEFHYWLFGTSSQLRVETMSPTSRKSFVLSLRHRRLGYVEVRKPEWADHEPTFFQSRIDAFVGFVSRRPGGGSVGIQVTNWSETADKMTDNYFGNYEEPWLLSFVLTLRPL